MGYSDYWELEILDHILNDGTYTPPTVWVGLSTADPGDDAATLAEPTGSGYARVSTAAADWSAASAGSKKNANVVTFPTASGSWGTISHVCLFDAETGVNLLCSGALTTPVAITTGMIPRFAAAALTVSLG